MSLVLVRLYEDRLHRTSAQIWAHRAPLEEPSSGPAPHVCPLREGQCDLLVALGSRELGGTGQAQGELQWGQVDFMNPSGCWSHRRMTLWLQACFQLGRFGAELLTASKFLNLRSCLQAQRIGSEPAPVSHLRRNENACGLHCCGSPRWSEGP